MKQPSTTALHRAAGTAPKPSKPMVWPTVATGMIGMVFSEYQLEAILVPEELSEQDLAPIFALAHTLQFQDNAQLARAWGMKFVISTPLWAVARLTEDKVCAPTAAWFQAIH